MSFKVNEKVDKEIDKEVGSAVGHAVMLAIACEKYKKMNQAEVIEESEYFFDPDKNAYVSKIVRYSPYDKFKQYSASIKEVLAPCKENYFTELFSKVDELTIGIEGSDTYDDQYNRDIKDIICTALFCSDKSFSN